MKALGVLISYVCLYYITHRDNPEPDFAIPSSLLLSTIYDIKYICFIINFYKPTTNIWYFQIFLQIYSVFLFPPSPASPFLGAPESRHSLDNSLPIVTGPNVLLLLLYMYSPSLCVFIYSRPPPQN